MARILFFVGLAITIVLLDVLIDNLPTLFDLVLVGIAAVVSVFAGRMSRDWF